MASDPNSFQVVVVGAGLSGLRAARELHNAGLSYVVLEAMDRVGGKTLSVQASPGGKGVLDMGAAWINDTTQSEIYNLAKEFGFDLVEQRTGGTNLYKDDNGEVHCIPYGMPAKVNLSSYAVLKPDLTPYSLTRSSSNKLTNCSKPLPSTSRSATSNVQLKDLTRSNSTRSRSRILPVALMIQEHRSW